jgi:hypothetical protein
MAPESTDSVPIFALFAFFAVNPDFCNRLSGFGFLSAALPGTP